MMPNSSGPSISAIREKSPLAMSSILPHSRFTGRPMALFKVRASPAPMQRMIRVIKPMIKRYTCRWAKKADSDKMLEMVHPSTPRGQVTRNRLEPSAMRIF